MSSDDMASAEAMYVADEFDLLVLEVLVTRPEMNYKDIAQVLKVDQRTVAKRIKTLTSQGVLKHTLEIDWSKLGLHAEAFVGSTTSKGIGYAQKLSELMQNDPRIIEAYETLGSFQYFMRVIETDTYRMRDSILRDLDLLAAELTTTLVTRKLKQDYRSLIRYLRETRFPRSRAHGNAIP